MPTNPRKKVKAASRTMKSKRSKPSDRQERQLRLRQLRMSSELSFPISVVNKSITLADECLSETGLFRAAHVLFF